MWENSPREENQRIINIRAKKTILAIGGWIMDGEKKRKYLGQDGHRTAHYCGPFSVGEGLEMAQRVGAALSRIGWSSFSGQLVAVTATPELAADVDGMLRMWSKLPPEDWTEPYSRGRLAPPSWLASNFPPFGETASTTGNARIPEDVRMSPGIVVNKQGERFYDEASPTQYWKYLREVIAVSRQQGGFAWLIGDKAIHDSVPGSAAMIQRIADEGGLWGNHGNVIVADTLEELAQMMADAGGTYRGAFLRTIKEYNAAVDAGTQEDLPVPHYTGNGSGGFAIRTPPFYAIPITAAPYCMLGGLRIDEHARVLDVQGTPISNLYAPPPLGGGIQEGPYMGAIACAGTFGYLAARHAIGALG